MTSNPSSPAPRPPLGPNPDLYPDLVAAGSLAAALVEVATEFGLALGELRQVERNLTYAGVASTAAFREPFSINIGSERRIFLFSAWSRGVELVTGKSTDLREVAEAALAWRNGASLRAIRDQFPFVTVSELAEAHERGPADAVEVKWRWLRESAAGKSPIEGIGLLVEAAYAEPKLRQLYPYTSHWTLCFTTCTGYPFTREVPFVDPLHDGRYRVSRPDRVSVIGETDSAEEAIAMVVDNLPADLGPAVAGTARDMKGEA